VQIVSSYNFILNFGQIKAAMLYNLGEQNSIANQFLLELRDKEIQKDRLRFRRNLERLGEIMAFEISKKLSYKKSEVETSLGKATLNTLTADPVLITILRAGLPFFQGFQNYFDKADCGFVGAYRKEGLGDIAIKLDYLATPEVEGKEVILIDPMLATGKSIVDTVKELRKQGTPKTWHIASLLASPQGINYLNTQLTTPFTLWTFAVDEKLNSEFYIVPGLGDAGDLSFGEKM
jgi:uracil phosphoribosyltransferase